ncbi:MAG: insulinase family protein, partial [Bacteroidetes bacterium]|nr:insulinase family protein [Bacteroidota bacterium]
MRKRSIGVAAWLLLLILSACSGVVRGQTFDTVKKQVKTHTLPNGMKFIVLERHDAPVVSLHTYADVGSAQESYGVTGISHI